MKNVRLIHWNAAEAEERGIRLRAAGFAVVHDPLTPDGLRSLREEPPDALVLDLSRTPSQGRDLALGLRKHKATRGVPLVFVGGDPEKVTRIRDLLPDATYTTWDAIDNALRQAIADPPEQPVVPASAFEAYRGTPLPKKLGLKAGSTLNLVGAPDGFEQVLGKLPDGVDLKRDSSEVADVTMWFVCTREELEDQIGAMGAFAEGGGLWIVWPKKTSGVVSDLSQAVVRKTGLASGLVDFKICSVDATWSGLRFTRRGP